jgi:putative FmdB family regulatory protein
MPIYEYRCTTCGGVFERIQKFSDPPLSACVTCDGKVEKLISRTAFQLKGGGWYASGYSSETGAASAPPAGAENKKENKKTSGTEEAGKDKRETGNTQGSGCGSACACH